MTKAAQSILSDVPENAAQPTLSDIDKRWSLRRNSRLPGVLTADASSRSVKCIVTDTSSTGAKLDVDPTNPAGEYAFATLPDKFWLYIKMDRAQVYCEAVWRNGGKMGVRFISPMTIKPREPSVLAAAANDKSKNKRSWPFHKAS